MVAGLAFFAHLFAGQLGAVLGVVDIAERFTGSGIFLGRRTQRLVAEQALHVVQRVQRAVALRGVAVFNDAAQHVGGMTERMRWAGIVALLRQKFYLIE